MMNAIVCLTQDVSIERNLKFFIEFQFIRICFISYKCMRKVKHRTLYLGHSDSLKIMSLRKLIFLELMNLHVIIESLTNKKKGFPRKLGYSRDIKYY